MGYAGLKTLPSPAARASYGAPALVALKREIRGLPFTAGIPLAEQSLMHAVEFNDLAAVETVAKRNQIGAIITEPVLQNVGVVKPDSGYMEGLRTMADRYGFLLIFDEVKTGFRASLGGYQQLCGVTPDLSAFGMASLIATAGIFFSTFARCPTAWHSMKRCKSAACY